MSALAGLLKDAGHVVSGSDVAFDPPIGPYLKQLGVRCLPGWHPENVDTALDLVVVGNVCRPDKSEARAAVEAGLRLRSMPQTLAELVLKTRRPFVVAGTHGKTTTSALVAHLLAGAGVDPGFFIGGIPVNVRRSSRLGSADAPFIVEGDEYDSAFFEKIPKFWSYQPFAAVLTSIEYDHVDIFANENAYVDAFERFVELIPSDGWLFAWAGDPTVRAVAKQARCQVRFYALGEDDCGDVSPMWLGARVESGALLDLFGGGSYCGRVHMPLFGRHNARNVVAALAMASDAAAAPLDELLGALPRFAGTQRRQEFVGRAGGVTVFDDFAHHPTAVRETLAGVHERFTSGRVIAVFEPRSATASRRLHQAAYPDAFGPAEVCVLAPVGRSEVPSTERLDTRAIAKALEHKGKTAHACESVDEAIRRAAEVAREGDAVVVMSNGRFGDAPDRILALLASR